MTDKAEIFQQKLIITRKYPNWQPVAQLLVSISVSAGLLQIVRLTFLNKLVGDIDLIKRVSWLSGSLITDILYDWYKKVHKGQIWIQRFLLGWKLPWEFYICENAPQTLTKTGWTKSVMRFMFNWLTAVVKLLSVELFQQ